MGQTNSKECVDKKGTDNLSAQDAENDIDKLRQIAGTGGSIAVSAYIDESLNRWKREQVKFAISGRGATGKSTFINKTRNLKPGDDGFAKTGFGDTTLVPTLYMHPKNDQIAFYDLPGYSTTTFKKEDYISEMKISEYDFVFIFFNHVLSEDEIWLVRELGMLGKPFALVRSKVDIDMENAIYDGKDEDMVIPEIKGKIKIALDANLELKDTKGIFLISSRKPNKGELSDLMAYVEEHIEEVKVQVLLFSLDATTKTMLERKHKLLQKRLILVTAFAAGVAAIPVEYIEIAVNVALLVHEVHHYMHVFGVKQERVYSLKDFDNSLLKCRALLEPNFDMIHFITAKLGTCERLLLTKYLPLWNFPFHTNFLHSAATAARTYTFLDDMLQDIKHDAVLLQEHINKTNADHRM